MMKTDWPRSADRIHPKWGFAVRSLRRLLYWEITFSAITRTASQRGVSGTGQTTLIMKGPFGAHKTQTEFSC